MTALFSGVMSHNFVMDMLCAFVCIFQSGFYLFVLHQLLWK